REYLRRTRTSRGGAPDGWPRSNCSSTLSPEVVRPLELVLLPTLRSWKHRFQDHPVSRQQCPKQMTGCGQAEASPGFRVHTTTNGETRIRRPYLNLAAADLHRAN